MELSVRPEAIALVPPSAEGAIPGTVDQAAYLGSTISYQVRTAGGLTMTVLTPKTGIRLPVGSDVAVTWPPSEALVLGGGPAGAPGIQRRRHHDRPARPVPRATSSARSISTSPISG